MYVCMYLCILRHWILLFTSGMVAGMLFSLNSVVLNLFHCWDPLNATDVIWDPQVKIEKVCSPE